MKLLIEGGSPILVRMAVLTCGLILLAGCSSSATPGADPGNINNDNPPIGGPGGEVDPNPDDPNPDDPIGDPPEEPILPLSSTAPRVSAGLDRQANASQSIDIDAIATDPDGTIVQIDWEQISGPAVTFSSSDSLATRVDLPSPTGPVSDVILKVTVTDNDGETASDEITIAVHRAANAVTSQVLVGAAVVDSTGPLGGSAGQYQQTACDFNPDPNACTGTGRVFPDDFDPSAFSSNKKGAYGVHSRTSVRAIVVEGSNGKRVALLKSDNYLAQDLVSRRVAQILADGNSGIGYDQILHSASHSHSSPYQLTKSQGVWVFQDRFSEVTFEAMANAMAQAIEEAAANMVPARMSGTSIEHHIVKGNIVRGAIAIDGTPAGYPVDFGDKELVLLRFEDVSVDPPRPIAFWLNWGQHPESLDGYHLISADYYAPLERYVDRELGAPLLITQGDVGSAEGPYARDAQFLTGRYFGLWQGFGHEGYAQLERQGRILADAVADANALIVAQDNVRVPWDDDFVVDFVDYFVPGPVSHPTPTISNCDANQTYEGNIGAPAAGLPECARQEDNLGFTMPAIAPVFLGLAPGTPVPGEFSAPAHPAVAENQRIHLQAFRLGEVLMASCACEPQVDMIINLKTRTDVEQGNIYDGFDWSPMCSQNDDSSWDCPNPRNLDERLPPIADADYQRMLAQIHNDAAGWDAPENAAIEQGQEPDDVTQIKGNFTKEELPAELGYALPIGLGHTGDYNGYTVSYREYRSRDSYRKALTAYGPHTADYMITRLVRMAGFMKGGPAVPPEPNAAQGDADEARQESQAQQTGAETAAAFQSFEASLPPDPGTVSITRQPEDRLHFSSAVIEWIGGSNGADNPLVRVERRIANQDWQPVADGTGEVQTMLTFPDNQAELNAARAGQFEWHWRANFEVFPALPANAGSIDTGEYRFVIEGRRKVELALEPYHLISDSFSVSPWNGITVADVSIDDTGVSLRVPEVVYPRSYDSEFFVINDDNDEINCETCSFRPWAKRGETVSVSIRIDDGVEISDIAASLDPSSGIWSAEIDLLGDEIITIPAGAIVDNNGQTNAEIVLRN